MSSCLVETQKPQLLMLRTQLDNLPESAVPKPYAIRSEGPGDDKAWEKIISESFGGSYSYSMMRNHKAYRPERVLFVTDKNDMPVATAASWTNEDFPDDCAVLHMVGVLPDYAGHRLGYHVCLAAMKQAESEGYVRMALTTDDWRIPAIKTYLRLGFMPIVVHENHIERWRLLLQKISREDLLGLIPSVYDGKTSKTL